VGASGRKRDKGSTRIQRFNASALKEYERCTVAHQKNNTKNNATLKKIIEVFTILKAEHIILSPFDLKLSASRISCIQ